MALEIAGFGVGGAPIGVLAIGGTPFVVVVPPVPVVPVVDTGGDAPDPLRARAWSYHPPQKKALAPVEIETPAAVKAKKPAPVPERVENAKVLSAQYADLLMAKLQERRSEQLAALRQQLEQQQALMQRQALMNDDDEVALNVACLVLTSR